MRDIRYKWNSGFKSVGISNEVQLPQFRVLGHRQRQTEINLSTGIGIHRDTGIGCIGSLTHPAGDDLKSLCHVTL